ncbi:adenylate cyclase [Pholiota conissans]|uniref:Adenylate cyclase n=1 Tax=Pholiota conissans TaxID=109636 RepID=A0A9P5Z2Q4_9AGAR|nr:adenylate cyclase [Pholiota conissans]
MVPLNNGNAKTRTDDRVRRRARNVASVSFANSSISGLGKGSLSRLRSQPPPGATYRMRMYTPNSAYHVIAIDLETTVASLTAKVSRKIEQTNGRVYLYLKEQGRERILGPNERPAAIVKLRTEQAGYDYEDGLHLLGIENLNILLKFVYKAQHLTGEEQINLLNYEVVDLTGQSLRVIPLGLYKYADQIVFLKLDRNPMIEIPLDFIQSCTLLRDLRMSHMSMKKVPQNIRHSTSLHCLDISCNSIRDLEDAILDPIPHLSTINAQNNRIESLPWHFARLKSLTTLNISNNKFRIFPHVITKITTLRDLDISFNMITELPDEIGLLKALERLTLVGNQVSKFPNQVVNLVMLKILDIRRNQFSDLSLVCNLPNMQTLSADHNSVHALDLSLGPRMKTLVVSHNDITQLTLSPGPLGRPPYALAVLDLSFAKLSSLDELALSQLCSLRTLKLDHNSFRSLPDSLGDLKLLENLSCTDNRLDYLPSTIGNLQELTTLDAHNNNLNELPQSVWECSKLSKINITSNFLSSWPEPPVVAKEVYTVDGSLTAPIVAPRKGSVASVNTARALPPLVRSLQKLYIGENCLTDSSMMPLIIFEELRVLNMSFNEIQDLPPNFFHSMTVLEELYLSGNKLTSIPSEDFPQMSKLSTIFLNGNRLVTLPQELGKVANLKVLDVGSNYLKYNINNLEFDWNWNFNTNLKYLNLSGNKRLQIKAESSSSSVRASRHFHSSTTPMLSGFTSLHQLKVLGLMDVTIMNTSQDATVDIPDESDDRRVRTSLSTVCGMGYGIADSMGKNNTLTMLDLVHEFQGRQDEALFAMFGRTHPPKHLPQGASPNYLTKYLHDKFVDVFKAQHEIVNAKLENEGVPYHQRKEGIPKALIWTFLKLNQDLWQYLQVNRKNSQASVNSTHTLESFYSRTGISCVAIYFFDRTLYAANIGNAIAIGSRQGVYHEISRKHDPFDRGETIRIRSAEGSISPSGLVNDDPEAKVSRGFGYYHLFPAINARPDILIYDLSDTDEFIIIANSGLWDFVPYQTAVDIARNVVRTERPDPMLAAQKLRDFAISYGADGSVMIMVILVADLFNTPSRSRQPTLDPILDQSYRRKKTEPGFKFLDYEIPAPTGHVTLVFTDIRNSTHLWEVNPGMPAAMRLHNTLLRRQLRLCGGYEVKTEGDAFMCSFPTTLAAVWFCLTVQVQLLHEAWPLEILECEDGKPIYDSAGTLLARGLSVRMGIHSGMPLCEPDLITHRMDYFGPMVNRSARIESNALGGQISCSNDIIREINARVLEVEDETEYSRLQNPNAVEGIRDIGVVIIPVGEVKLKGIELPEILSIIYPSGLEGRHDLKDAPVDPTVSASRVQFSVPQIQELGMLCLRIEALSTRRLFKPLPGRKNSIQSNNELEDNDNNHRYFYSDPNLLLPSINHNSTDTELMFVLDSLSVRIANAINTVCELFKLAPDETVDPPMPIVTKEVLMAALLADGYLDEETLQYIATTLDRSH